MCDGKMKDYARHIFESKGLAIQITQGTRYLGGHIGTEREKAEWLEPKVRDWAAAVGVLERIYRHYFQTAYYGMVVSLQNEC